MSVLVRGMDMPKSCYSCNFCQYYAEVNQGCYCVALFADLHRTDFVKERLASCPLIEVPTPHGRLIDVEELEKRQFDYGTGTVLPIDWDDIANAQTIIKGEE